MAVRRTVPVPAGLPALLVLLALSGMAATAGAQGGLLRGRVVDSVGAPVGDAQVSVSGTFWRTTTRRDGAFALVLAPGRWTVRVQHIGFAPASLDVAWPADTARLPIVVALLAAPAALPGVTVTGEAAPAAAQTISRESMQRLPALGEADVFRALPLLPSVSMYDDLLGRVQLAGGASDEHGVRLNGHPMEAPFHLFNIFGAFNVAALDRADVLMHHLPSDVDGRLSGLVDVRTRTPSAEGAGEGVVSLLASSLTLERPDAAAGVDVLASARVTYVDKVLGAWATSIDSDKDLVAPSYVDGVVTLSRAWGRVRAEATAYGTRDHLWIRNGTPTDHVPTWGEYLVGLHVSRDGARWTPSLRLSTSALGAAGWRLFTNRESGIIDVLRDSLTPPAPWDGAELGQGWTSGAVELRRSERRWWARGGLAADRRTFEYEWYGSTARQLLNSGIPLAYRARASQTVGAAYVEAAHTAAGWELTGGARVSLLDGRPLLAPRVLASRWLSTALRVDAALDRRHQWDAMGRTPELGSTLQPVYPLRRARMVDAASLTGAWRPAASASGRRVGVDVALYARRYRERALVDSARAELPARPLGFDDFPRVGRTTGRTLGASLSGDVALPGGLSLRGSYTGQSAVERIDGQLSPTDWDAPHQLALAGAAPLRWGWSLTSALQLRSGVPTTPVAMRIYEPQGWSFGPRYVYGERNSARLDAFRRLDVGLRRGWRGWDADWVFSLQAVNVLRDVNALSYDWQQFFACQAGPCRGDYADRRGLPLLPSIGLEVRW